MVFWIKSRLLLLLSGVILIHYPLEFIYADVLQIKHYAELSGLQ
jgi:hypothetical protein